MLATTSTCWIAMGMIVLKLRSSGQSISKAKVTSLDVAAVGRVQKVMECLPKAL